MRIRGDLFAILKGTQFSVLPLIPSLFIHIGTTPEYAEHLSINLPLLGFERLVASPQLSNTTRKPYHTNSSNTNGGTNGEHKIKPTQSIANSHEVVNNCIMYSILTDEVSVGNKSVIEYSILKPDSALHIGQNSILSQVHVPAYITLVPDNVFVHTMVIKRNDNSQSQYMTICFGIHDDLKASGIESLSIAGLPLIQILPFVGLSASDLWRSNESNSMWNARLFPTSSSPQESSRISFQLVDIIQRLHAQGKKNNNISIASNVEIPKVNWKNEMRCSLNEASELKAIFGQSEFRISHERVLMFESLRSFFKQGKKK